MGRLKLFVHVAREILRRRGLFALLRACAASALRLSAAPLMVLYIEASAWHAAHRARAVGLLARFAPGARRIADIGTGYGLVARDLAAAFPEGRVFGLDVLPARAAAWRIAGRGMENLEFRVGDAGALPFEGGSLDAALLLEVVEHVPDYAKVLAEAARALAPGGVLVLSTPDAPVERHPEHVHNLVANRAIFGALADAGFELLREERHPLSDGETVYLAARKR